jgi:hypothetical protein
MICGCLPLAIRLSILGIAPVPVPSIHDEFSHLLLADTLAHGRLANPTHPMWRHFESIHIIQRPTYSSMYPPAQGSFLALGQVLFGQPWAGVLISVGLMFAAMCWMMQGWLPPAWALFGTLIAILKFGISGLWIDSYLGGSAAAIGGALLVGSLPRMRQPGSRALHGAFFGLGLVILMNSRPFEGAVLAAAAFLYLAPGLVRKFRQKRGARPVAALTASAAAVFLCGAAFTAYYNVRVTGNPLRMPYQVNRDTYGWPENLAFLAPKQMVLRHKVLEDMYQKEVHNRAAYWSVTAAIDSLLMRLFEVWTFFIGPILTIPLLFLRRVFHGARTRPLVFFLATLFVLNLFQLVLYPYHLAPVVPVLFAIVAQGLRHLYVNFSRFSGRRAVYAMIAVPTCLILVIGLKHPASDLGLPLAYWERATEPHGEARAYIQDWLSARSQKQLVVVRYAPYHPVNQEWVYNRADIDGSKVAWAREMDCKSNGRLFQYFSDREIWLLEADVYPQRVVRYKPPDLDDDSVLPE